MPEWKALNVRKICGSGSKPKICESTLPWKPKLNLLLRTRHVCIYDYLGGHKDFIRLIFVTAIEKLQIFTSHALYIFYFIWCLIHGTSTLFQINLQLTIF